MNVSTQFDFNNTENKVHKTYDELLLPRMFIPLAETILEEADIKQDEHILDLACGPGTVARLAANKVGLGGRVLALDISSAMLEVAKDKPVTANSAHIKYEESPASSLNVPDNSFDKTICQQGLQFFPDRKESLKEMVRVTKPGGKINIAVWGPIDSCTIFHKLYLAMAESIPGEIAELLKAPFSLHDAQEIKELMHSVGLKNYHIKNVTLPLVFENGIEQAIQVLEATPFYPQIKELNKAVQKELSIKLHEKLEPLLLGEKVQGQMISRLVSIEVNC
ncbi:MAG: methyltransferase domain-containing protein [Nitrospinae bacterium]|nr:methyltransferase domain-containing protein [Nitrospinota bacterium]